MSAAFGVDASVPMAWLFQEGATPQTARLLDRLSAETALVPGWWFLEIANVLALAARKARITPAQSTEFIEMLSRVGIEIGPDSPERTFGRALPLCRAHQLTSYDALYLDLAVRHGLPLATLDEPLRKAARKLGIELLGR